eukprot:IDg23499t1
MRTIRQTHTSTGYPPFELVLSRLPPNLAMEDYTPPIEDPKEARERWIFRLRSHMQKAGKALKEAQARYKRNYDQRLRRRRKCLKPGGYAFLRRRNLRKEEVSLDRVEYAPSPLGVEEDPSIENESEQGLKPPEHEFYVVDSIVNHRQEHDAPTGHLQYLVKWFGFQDRTWEPIGNLRRSMII